MCLLHSFSLLFRFPRQRKRGRGIAFALGRHLSLDGGIGRASVSVPCFKSRAREDGDRDRVNWSPALRQRGRILTLLKDDLLLFAILRPRVLHQPVRRLLGRLSPSLPLSLYPDDELKGYNSDDRSPRSIPVLLALALIRAPIGAIYYNRA